MTCRAKEELKRQGEAVKQRQEEEQRVKQEQEKRLIEITQQQKEMLRQEVVKRLPAEPPADQPAGSTTCIRFRLPEGKTSTRRFLADEPLQVLLDYLLVEGFPHSEYKVLSSWPRKDVNYLTAFLWFLWLLTYLFPFVVNFLAAHSRRFDGDSASTQVGATGNAHHRRAVNTILRRSSSDVGPTFQLCSRYFNSIEFKNKVKN